MGTDKDGAVGRGRAWFRVYYVTFPKLGGCSCYAAIDALLALYLA